MRRRDISRWSPGTLYSSADEFCREFDHEGLHSIQLGGSLLDIWVVDRGAGSTLITFQHRVSERTPYPKFVGEKIASELGINLVAVADPSVISNNAIRLGWYLGNRDTGPLKKHLLPILESSLAFLGADRRIFFGNSGGGFAAVNYAQHFSGSIALTINPRLGFEDGLTDDLVKFIRLGHQAEGRTPFNRLRSQYANNLWQTVRENADFHLGMYHNSGDTYYYDLNHKQFVEARRDDLLLMERVEFDGDGHIPIPRHKLVDILDVVADPARSASDALRAAGFSAP